MDRHEAFFRPGEKGKRKRSRRQPATKKRRKNSALTDKQRQTWAREHYELNHGNPGRDTTLWAEPAIPPSDLDMTTSPATPATPLTPPPSWSPQIMDGHHNQPDHSHNVTMPITPTKFHDMFQYWEDLSQDHDDLRNLNMFNF